MPIKRYRISPHAARELTALRLTIGDVAVILRWGEKRSAGNGTSYLLKQWCIPQGQEKKLRRLLGIEVVTSGRRIERICHLRKKKPSRGKEETDD
ncbi:MAG: hypothetical protein DMF64_00230 [Acidobacteria bacterium]|nr:MAG: hypothetical protein DMF64_00230 [Acidobacteriota bacterium]